MIAAWVTLGLLCQQPAPDASSQVGDQRSFGANIEEVWLDLLAPQSRSTTSFTVREGLPTNSITALAYDADGFLIVGTTGGLARYDGTTFELLFAEDCPGLDGDRILTLYPDAQGRIWVGADMAAPSLYSDGKFRTICSRSDLNSVRQIEPSHDGSHWLAGHVLARVVDDQVEVVPFVSGDPDVWPQAILEDETGRLWVASDQGVFAGGIDGFELVDKRPSTTLIADFSGEPWCVDTNGTMFQPLEDPEPEIDLGVGTHVPFLGQLVLDDRRRLQATEIGVLMMEAKHPDGTGLRVKVLGDTLLSNVESSLISHFLPAGSDELWIGTNLGGLDHLEPLYSRLAELPNRLRKRPVASVHQVGEDRAIVFGSYPNELFLLDGDGVGSRLELAEPGAYGVRGVATSVHGTWAATNQGLVRLEGKLLVPEPGWRSPCRFITAHTDGSIWAMFSGAVHRVVDSDGRLQSPEASPGHETPAGVVQAVGIYRDSIVIGTNDEIFELDEEGGRWKSLATLDDVKLRNLRAGDAGELWLSTYGQGLIRLSPNGQLDRWSSESGASRSVPGMDRSVQGRAPLAQLELGGHEGQPEEP